MTSKPLRDMEWSDYLDRVERLHGKAARDIAERNGSADAGDAANIRMRQRMSWRQKMMKRRRP